MKSQFKPKPFICRKTMEISQQNFCDTSRTCRAVSVDLKIHFKNESWMPLFNGIIYLWENAINSSSMYIL